jgi:hypothetical protein
LELGFARVFQPMPKNNKPIKSAWSNRVFKPKDKRYKVEVGPVTSNQYDYRWVEYADTQTHIVKSPENYQLRRQGNTANSFKTIGIAFKEFCIGPL